MLVFQSRTCRKRASNTPRGSDDAHERRAGGTRAARGWHAGGLLHFACDPRVTLRAQTAFIILSSLKKGNAFSCSGRGSASSPGELRAPSVVSGLPAADPIQDRNETFINPFSINTRIMHFEDRDL